MDQYFPDLEFTDHTNPDVSDPSAMLPFDFMDCTKSDNMFMFYPELGYDLQYSQLMSQRKRTDSEKYNPASSFANDGSQVPAHHLMVNNTKLKTKPKLVKSLKNPFDSMLRSTVSSQSATPILTVDNSEKNRKIFYCRDCGKSFKFQTSLLRHNNKVHNCKYQCPTCHRVFSRQAYLDVHVSKPGSSCFSNYLNAARSRNLKI